MLSLLRTQTEQLQWISKRKKPLVKAVIKRMCGECPVAEVGAPGSGAPRTLFLAASTIGFWRFEVHLSCSVWVLRRDSISAHVWYGLRTNLCQLLYLQHFDTYTFLLTGMTTLMAACSNLVRILGMTTLPAAMRNRLFAAIIFDQ